MAGPHGFDITVPPRRHDIAAIDSAALHYRKSGKQPGKILREARRCGRSLAEHSPGQDLVPLLSVLGFEPRSESWGIELLNRTFHEPAEEDRNTVCGMNLALLQGVMDVLPDQ